MEFSDLQDFEIDFQGKHIEYSMTAEGSYGLLGGLYCMELHSKAINISNLLASITPSPLIMREFMKQSSCYLGEGLINIYRNRDQDSDQYPFVTQNLRDEVDSLLDRQDLGDRDFLQPYFIVMAKEPISPWRRGEEMRPIPVCAYQFSGMEFLIGLDQAYSIFDMDYHDHIIGGEYPE